MGGVKDLGYACGWLMVMPHHPASPGEWWLS